MVEDPSTRSELRAEPVRSLPPPRGRLRIYFGYARGIETTQAMLAAARRQAAAGRDVVVATLPSETGEELSGLLEGLERLPAHGAGARAELRDFDLDAALLRHPELLVLGDLAHGNPPDRRHPQRWQDAEELLAAGIDVFTTLDVEHLVSLSDVVGAILERPVGETVPDTVFDGADEVVLVDLPMDELLSRAARGRGHVAPGTTERPPLRRGDSIALRELALRRTADRVEDDLLAYRKRTSIAPVWKTANALLACVGPDEGAERVVRAAARLASQLNADWHALYVETPSLARLPAARRERILATLNLARDLGASTAVSAHADVADGIIAYARRHNLSKLVIGRDPHRRLWPWQRSSGQRLALLAPDIDLVEIGRAPQPRAMEAMGERSAWASSADRRKQWRGFLWASLACAAVTLVCLPWSTRVDRSNVVALFMLAVVLIAMRFGRGPAALAAVLSVGAFDYFFVAPPWRFTASHAQYLLTFCVTLAVGLITGQLTAGLRYQARVAAHREERAAALYEIASKLSGAVEAAQVVEIGEAYIQRTFHAAAAVLLPGTKHQLEPRVQSGQANGFEIDIGIAQWAYEHGRPAGFGTDTLPGTDVLYVPLRAPLRSRGVLAVKARNRRLLRIPEQRQLLDTLAALIAIALERVHYVGIAQSALVRMESERLRNSLLSALSHDLRTPLTVLVGLAESLALTKPPLSPAQLETTEAIQEEARRMSTLVGNLLEMARIESGEVQLNLQWQPLEEVVGAALEAMRTLLARHKVEVRLPADLPLLRFDALLLERVFVNLLENAAKYTPPGSTVTLTAEVLGDSVRVLVADDGPGLPRGREEAVFQKFTRGERESATPGVGLGLAICRAIIESHHGTIVGATRPGGGATFTFTLPLGTPPVSVPEPEAIASHG